MIHHTSNNITPFQQGQGQLYTLKRDVKVAVFSLKAVTKHILLLKGIFLFPPSLINLETDREHNYESWYKA